MANNLYTTKTAALKATKADINKLDAKKMLLNGKNILEYIKESVPVIKHSQDTRETVTENDLWGQWVETKSDGTIIIHDDWVTNPNASSSKAWNTSITKVEDNKTYVGDTLYANIQLEKIKNGDNMFQNCSQLESFTSDLSSLTNGNSMFYCANLSEFSSDLSSLTNGTGMFEGCSNLTSFTSDLSSLTNGSYMFDECKKLTSFSSDLSSLTDGEFMFSGCTNLKSFSSDLPNLTDVYGMFNQCSNLTSFNSDLSSLTNGNNMFSGCTNLKSFSSTLPSLTTGDRMFNKCKIDAESVMYIADTIKDITAEKQLYIDGTIPYVTLSNGVYSATRGFMSNGKYVYTYDSYDYNSKRLKPHTTTISDSYVGKLTLGINVTNDSSTIQQQLEDFAKEATFDSWSDLKTYFSNKGWTVTFKYGESNESITYGLRGGEQIIPCQIFAKLIEISEEDKDSAQYCNEDASSFCNIEWGHDVTNTDGYTIFDSLEDAMAAWHVFPKENIITSEEEA